MGYRNRPVKTQVSGASSSITVTLDTHASGQVIVLVFAQDVGGTAIAPDATAASAGWTMVGTQAASGASRAAVAYLVCDSAAEANPTFTGSNEEWIVQQYVLSDLDTAALLDATHSWQRTDWNNAYSTATSTVSGSSNGGSAITPPVGSLLLVAACSDSANFIRFKTDEVVGTAQTGDNSSDIASSNIMLVSGFRQVDGSATCPTLTLYSAANNEGGNIWIVAFKTASGGNRERDCRTGMDEIAWHGSFASTLGTITWNGLDDITSTPTTSITVDGTSYTVSSTNPTVSTASNSASIWGRIATLANGDITTGSGWLVGGSRTLASAIDMTNQVYFLNWLTEFAFNSARVGAEGVIVFFSDGTNVVGYRLRYLANLVASNLYAATIALGKATACATVGSINWAAITRIGYGWHRNSGVTTTHYLAIKNEALLAGTDTTAQGNGRPALTGGGSGRGANFTALYDALTGWGHYKAAEKLGSGMVLPKCGFSIGDGATTTVFDASASPIEFPPARDTTTQLDHNADANSLTVVVKADSGDVINLTAFSAVSRVQQNWTFDAATSAGASYSETGGALIGFAPTWVANAPISGQTVKQCGSVQIGCNVTGATISETTATTAPATITENDLTIESTSISCVKYGGGVTSYHLSLESDVTELTLNGVTLSGTPGTDKIYSALASGTLTITTDGTGTSLSESDVTFVGGSTAVADIVAPQPTLGATVLANTRVVLYNRTTDAELDNTFVSGTSWSKVITSGASPGDVLDLYTFKEGDAESVATVIYAGTDATFAVEQTVDAVIASLRTELSITDYTTITEFAPDTTGHVYIEVDDPDGNTQKARAAVWYNGILTTEGGARYFRGGMTMLSTAAFRIEVDVVDMLFENLDPSTPVKFTDIERRLYRSDGSTIIAPTSYSIHNDYNGVPDTVETGVSGLTGPESAQLMGIPSATITRTEKLLRNKMITDPATGVLTIYDDDGTTPLVSGDIFEDAAGSQPYRGQGAERRERLE